ncbi:MAG: hypothetical protein GY771_06690 [bacterium]|nr:hypothetical protein [bacterium]
MKEGIDMGETEYPVPDEIEQEYAEAVRSLKEYKWRPARAILLSLLERYPEEPRLLNSLGNTYFASEAKKRFN